MGMFDSFSQAVAGLKERRRSARKPTDKQLREAFARLAATVQSRWEAFLAEHGYDQDQLLQGCGVPWVDVASGGRTDAFLPGGAADQLIAQGKEPTAGVGQDFEPDSRGHSLREFGLELCIRAAGQMHLASVACHSRGMDRKQKHATMAAVGFSYLFFRLKLELNWQRKIFFDPSFADERRPDEFISLPRMESLPDGAWQYHRLLLDVAMERAMRGEARPSRRPGQGASRLLSLDRECLAAVLGFLGNRDLVSASMTCTALHAHVSSDRLAPMDPALRLQRELLLDAAQQDYFVRRFAAHPPDGTQAFELGMKPAPLAEPRVESLAETLKYISDFSDIEIAQKVQATRDRLEGEYRSYLEPLAPEPPRPLSSKLAAFKRDDPLPPLPEEEPGSLGDALRHALCDVAPLEVQASHARGKGGFSASGGTVAFQHLNHMRRNSRCMTAMGLHYKEPVLHCDQSDLHHSLDDFLGGGVLIDEANGAIWAAGSAGATIEGFGIPAPLTRAPPRPGFQNPGLEVRHVLCPPARQRCVGMHAEAGSVFSIGRRGAVSVWRLGELEEDDHEPHFSEGTDDHGRHCSEDSDEGDSDSEEGCYATVPSAGYRGKRPTETFNLHLPSPLKEILYAKVAPIGGGQHTAAVVCKKALLLYDWETARLRHSCFGHLSGITDVAAAPETLPLGPLLATSSRDGSVKVWDLRCPASRQPAVVTLTVTDNSDGFPLCCCFAESCSSASVLFTGCEQSIAAWDLRSSTSGATARALYKLSTGNNIPEAMAWNAPSSSLLVTVASCTPGPSIRDFYSISAQDPDTVLRQPATWAQGPHEVFRWPKRAAHRPSYFRAPWTLNYSCLVSYTFNASATKRIDPQNDRFIG